MSAPGSAGTSPSGPDDPWSVATPTAPPSSPPFGPPPQSAGGPPNGAGYPVQLPSGIGPVVPPSTKSTRSRVGVSVGVVGVAMVLLVSVVAVRGFNGQSSGASSPDSLVSELQSALTKKDPAAGIALLDPAEVPTLGELYKTTVVNVRTGQDVDIPRSFDALQINLTNVSHTTTYMGDRHEYAKVSFDSGELSWSTQPSRLPDEVKKRITEDGGSLPEPDSGVGSTRDLQVTTDSGKVVDPFLMLVKDNGRWYISLTMTAGQYAVEAGDLPAGQFDDTPQPGPPAASPEAAITTALDTARDVANKGSKATSGISGTLAGLFPEAETRAFRVYSKASAQGIGKGGNAYFGGTGTESDPSANSGDDTFNGLAAQCAGCGVSYSDLGVKTVKQGSQTYAVISSLTVKATYRSCSYSYIDSYDDPRTSPYDDFSGNGNSSGDYGAHKDCTTETTSAVWDGHCLTLTVSDTTADDAGPHCLDAQSGPGQLNAKDFGITDVHVVVKQERGGWVIDPVATVFDYGRTAISHLNDPKVKSVLRGEH